MTRQLTRLCGVTSTCHLVFLLIKPGDVVQSVMETGGLTNSAGTITHLPPADLWRRALSRGHSECGHSYCDLFDRLCKKIVCICLCIQQLYNTYKKLIARGVTSASAGKGKCPGEVRGRSYPGDMSVSLRGEVTLYGPPRLRINDNDDV